MNSCVVRKTLVAAGFVAATLGSNVALAVEEMEPNGSISAAQPLTIVQGTPAEVTGSIGATTYSVTATFDVDYYSFDGTAGDLVTVDINGGMKDGGPTNPIRSVDTVIALFDANGTMLYLNDDADDVDAGSIATNDSRIVNAVLPATGRYTVGVTSFPNSFQDGGTTSASVDSRVGNGSYTLTISGVTPPPPPPVVENPPPPPPPVGDPGPVDPGPVGNPGPVAGGAQQVNIDIRPRHPGVTKIWAYDQGKIAVALLSSSSFDPMKVDRRSLTFGAEGNEASLIGCHHEGVYVNRDRRKDLVCRFDLKAASFEVGDVEGVLRGTVNGQPFEGHAPLRVYQWGKKRKHQHNYDRWDRRADRR